MGKKVINLALQGGGAHGAYTWGVLDRLLEEKDLVIEGVSGTSAGAMNAAMMVNGYISGGAEGARECLGEFWRRISQAGAFSPLRKSPWERMLTGWNLDYSLAYHWLDLWGRIYSPYMLNPFNINPMRGIIEDLLDEKAIASTDMIKLFISATHINSGQARVFKQHEITPDVLLASACIPFIFQAVEIHGEYYWDGGYMGNPALWPLIYNCKSEDLLLVQINPIHDDEHPRTATDIINRLNEITFNSSLIAEMRAIEFVSRLLSEKRLDPERYKSMRVHLIYSADHMHHLNASSKMNVDWDFFLFLKDIGRESAEHWLERHWDDIGVKCTVDIRRKFLQGPGSQPDMSMLPEVREALKKKADREEQEQMQQGEQI